MKQLYDLDVVIIRSAELNEELMRWYIQSGFGPLGLLWVWLLITSVYSCGWVCCDTKPRSSGFPMWPTFCLYPVWSYSLVPIIAVHPVNTTCSPTVSLLCVPFYSWIIEELSLWKSNVGTLRNLSPQYFLRKSHGDPIGFLPKHLTFGPIPLVMIQEGDNI